MKTIVKNIKKTLRKVNRTFLGYVLTNKLFLSYVILSLLGLGLARYFTLGETMDFRIFIANISLILILGSIGYLVKIKNRFKYFFVLLLFYTALELVNTVYYKFYASFASFSELATAGQTETVFGSIIEKMNPLDFIYILLPIIFYVIHSKLKRSPYYNYKEKVERTKRRALSTFMVGLCALIFIFATSTPTDYSRLQKQWNRVLNVERFGLLFYQFNDIVQTVTPRISSLFGYEEAALEFNEYYAEKEPSPENKYTGILEGKNVVFIHMESIQTFLMDLQYNGEDVLPFTKQLANEGMYFTDFYPQISTGTSSDTEFTLLTSLYPAASGTVFVSYHNRYYETSMKIMGRKDYHTFSMHGNDFSMWNRTYAHPSLGYEDFYFKDKYTFTDEDKVGLGINDSMFFDQSFDYLVNIENTYPNYMGTMITLSNHSPFPDVTRYSQIDLSTTYEEINEEGVLETFTTDYLSDESIGKYIKSAHYADQALGEFFTKVNESENFNDTVFVMYGDHDARFNQSEINYLYNYDYKTGQLKEETDETYIPYDAFDHELNKSTPLIIWTKNEEVRKELNGTYDYKMGMIDVSPTLLNMLGEVNDYALGNDIFNTKEENYVVFPNVSFVSKDIYYNNSTGEYKALHEGVILSDDYIPSIIESAEKDLNISNSIVVHDLIQKEVLDKEEE